MRWSWCVCVWLAVCVCGAEQQAQAQAGGEWSVLSALSLSSVEAPHNGTECRLAARLRVSVEWSAPGGEPDDRLLRFQVSEVSLQTLGGGGGGGEWAARGSVWGGYSGGAVWARVRHGRVTHVYLRHDQPAHYTNYERALLSLFQFQVSADAEFHNETDITGECSGFYEQMAPLVYRKIKRTCVWGETLLSAAEEEDGVTSRRLTRVELAPGTRDILAANLIVSEEETRAGGAEGVRARAWHRLERVGPPAPPAPPAASRPPTPPEPPAPPLPLSSLLPDYTAQDELEGDKEQLVPLVSGALEQVSRGAQRFVWAALHVLPALERADVAALTALLHHHWDHQQLSAVYRVLGLARSVAAWRVAARALALSTSEPHHLATTYLEALAHAQPQEEVVSALVSLCGAARSGAVRDACGAAVGGAGAHTTPSQHALNYLLAALADCKEEAQCVSAVSGAAAARCGACAAALRRVLTDTDHAHARILACGALGDMSARELGAETLRALERTALALDRPDTIEVRGVALSAWLRVSARAAHRLGAASLQHDVTLLFRQLALTGPAELVRFAWQQLAALGSDYPCARAHLSALRAAAPDLIHYYQPGMSFFTEVDAWKVGGWRVRVRGAGLARRGVLRDARVALQLDRVDAHHDASPRAARSVPLAALQLRTRGMHHVAAEMPTPAERREAEAVTSLSEEEVSAWLGTEAWGHAALLPLFTSQGGLAAAVWAGAGASWARVRRGVARGGRGAARVPSVLGVLLHVRTHHVRDLSIHAHAQVSLWSRSAVLGAGTAVCARRSHGVEVRTAWGTARATRDEDVCGALRVPAVADFYADVAVCVRPSLHPLTIRWECLVQSAWGGASLRRRHGATVTHAARGVSLGADNDAQCRTLTAHDTLASEEELAALEALAL